MSTPARTLTTLSQNSRSGAKDIKPTAKARNSGRASASWATAPTTGTIEPGGASDLAGDGQQVMEANNYERHILTRVVIQNAADPLKTIP
jgi:hypothetical protein